MNNYEGRLKDLQKRINEYFRKITNQDIDYFSKLNSEDLIGLKKSLSDINNLLTLNITNNAADWICSYFKIDNINAAKIRREIDETKPNTRGYDIQVSEPYKIIAEVKCISPVNNGEKFGSAQWDAIMDDCRKLKNGKSSFKDSVSQYYKFLFLSDLGERTDHAIAQMLKSSKSISQVSFKKERHEIKRDIELFNPNINFSELSKEKIYLKTILMT